MSHFTVLVIGENIEDQLAPYHEFESTGVDDQYVQEVDVTEKVKKMYQDEIAQKPTNITLEEFTENFYHLSSMTEADYHIYQQCGEFPSEYTYGFFIVTTEGKLKQVIQRTNPNAHWDWYQIGGRWRGYFKLKPGIPINTEQIGDSGVGDNPPLFDVDQARKGDIDFEGMIQANIQRAKDTWRNYLDQCCDSKGKLLQEQAGNAYFKFGISKEMTYDQYIREHASFSTFAVVKDKVWYERGEMGWWACVSNEKDFDTWEAFWKELIDTCDDNTLFTLVDCHI